MQEHFNMPSSDSGGPAPRSAQARILDAAFDVLRARGYGATHPICSERNEDCRRVNRRASFSILEFAEPPGRI